MSPGIGFGEFGDGHVRFAMIENEARTRQAIRGIKQMFRDDVAQDYVAAAPRRRPRGSTIIAALKPLNVGLLGFGTVGRGTFDVLARNAGEIARRAGRPIEVSAIATRTPERARAAPAARGGVDVSTDLDAAGAAHATSTSSCELIGGIEPARDAGPRGDRARQARRHRQQGAARASRHRDLRRGARARA